MTAIAHRGHSDDQWRVTTTHATMEGVTASPKPKAHPKLVLLVEDNEDALVIYGQTLRNAGYEVIEAPSLAEAREAALARRPDVIVLDCRLPDGDGLGQLGAWRRSPVMNDVPCVVVTASRERQDMEAAVLAGADRFVAKPCSGQALVLHVQKALTGQRSSTTMRKV